MKHARTMYLERKKVNKGFLEYYFQRAPQTFVYCYLGLLKTPPKISEPNFRIQAKYLKF